MIYLLIANMISGVIDILRAVEARRLESGGWRLNIAVGTANILSAAACLFCLKNVNILVYVYAIGMIYSGCLRIVSAFRKSAIVYIR